MPADFAFLAPRRRAVPKMADLLVALGARLFVTIYGLTWLSLRFWQTEQLPKDLGGVLHRAGSFRQDHFVPLPKGFLGVAVQPGVS